MKNGWPSTKLGDVIDIHDSRRIPLSGSQRSQRQGPFPYYGAQGIIDHIDDYIFEGRHLLIAEDGENLRSRKQPIALFADGKFWVNNHAHIITAKPDRADDRFIASWLNQANLSAYVTGAAQPKLSQGNLKQIEIPLPDLPTQRRIAGILSAYDDLIENNLRRIRILEEMAQSLYREWFVHFRFPGHESVPLVDSPLGPIPEGWEVKTLDEVTSEIIDYRGKTPAKLGGEWSDSGILALSALNVKTGHLVKMDQAKFVDEKLYEKWMKSKLQRHDILLTSEAPLGEVYLLPDDTRYCLSQRLFGLRPNRKEISPSFLFRSLVSDSGQAELQQRATGTTVRGIRQAALRTVPVLVPDEGIREMAEPVLAAIEDQLAVLHRCNQTLRQTRDLLLPKLLQPQSSNV